MFVGGTVKNILQIRYDWLNSKGSLVWRKKIAQWRYQFHLWSFYSKHKGLWFEILTYIMVFREIGLPNTFHLIFSWQNLEFKCLPANVFPNVFSWMCFRKCLQFAFSLHCHCKYMRSLFANTLKLWVKYFLHHHQKILKHFLLKSYAVITFTLDKTHHGPVTAPFSVPILKCLLQFFSYAGDVLVTNPYYCCW